MAKTFYNKSVSVTCESKSNRSGFYHLGKLYYQNRLVLKKKIQYYNRTWEAWEFQSLLENLLDKAKKELPDKAIIDLKALIEKENGVREAWVNTKSNNLKKAFKMIDIMLPKRKANKAKMNLLRSEFRGGLVVPSNWDELDEDEKQTRLNKAVEAI